jgi:outer membrane protein assembly factor BamD
MLRPTLRFLLGIALFAFGFVAAHADLVWTPGQGWKVEGGVLAGLSGEEGRNALELMNNARNAEEAGELKRAIKGYDRVSKRFPNSVYAAEALYRRGLLHEKRREYYRAFDSFQELVQKYPNNPRFDQVIADQYRISSGLLEGKRAYIWGVIPGFRNREKAIEYLERVVSNAPYSDYAPLSLMNIARGHQRARSSEEAIDALDRMINSYPRNVLTPDAYLKLAETHSSLVAGPAYDQASTKSSITYYEDFLIQFPGDSGAGTAENGLADMRSMLAESKMILADYYYKHRRNYKAARVFYNEAITTFPDSPVAARARTMLADVDARLEGQNPETPAPAAKKKRFGLF